MGRFCRVLGRAALALVAVGIVVVGVPAVLDGPRDAKGSDPGPEPGVGDPAAVAASYARWRAEREGSDAGRTFSIGLHSAKGMSTEPSDAYGAATIDVAAGSVEVEVTGIAGDAGFEVWLLDNLPGPGQRSVLPEPGDGLIRLGALGRRPGGDGAVRLTAHPGPEALAAFEVDAVLVARAGEDPTASRVLVGLPTLFQRLDAEAWRKAAAPRAEDALGAGLFPDGGSRSLLARALGPAPAYADGGGGGGGGIADLVAQGEDLFVNGVFEGNGRTCATCHPLANNFTIDPAFIATLPKRDPLFVAELQPALAENFENPKLMRQFGLILENVDGADDLENKFVMRGVPHTLALPTSIKSPAAAGVVPVQRTGWSGDGAPGTGTLREFATGAVFQHFTKTLDREAGIDFVPPTDEELDAMEAFQLSLGRQEELDLSTIHPTSVAAAHGMELFNDPTKGKCRNCHLNAGATPSFGMPGVNRNFNTAVELLPGQPADLTGEPNPPDGGLGTTPMGDHGFGDMTFNTPVLVEAADTPPFFHNNSIMTIEGAVDFYNSTAFNDANPNNKISLEPTEVEAIAALLRILNALENIRLADGLASRAKHASFERAKRSLSLAIEELKDAIGVLVGGSLNLDAVQHLEKAIGLALAARLVPGKVARNALIDKALARMGEAASLIAD